MGQQIPITTSFQLPNGSDVTIETGKLASQAHGSVVVRIDNTMIFASVVSSYEEKAGQDFFPLSVDYQEKFAAVGRIPGNFFRRETRLNDYEILISRLVDRAIRPLFPENYKNETQVIIQLISGEAEVLPDAYAALAASAALSISDIPFAGPISEVRVARINGKFIVNPYKSDLDNADLDIIVAATFHNVMMVEGEANECQEADLIEAIKVGHEAIKIQCNAQLELAKKLGEKAAQKREIEEVEEDAELTLLIANFAKSDIEKISRGALDKLTRKNSFKALVEELKAHLLETKGEEYIEEKGGKISEYFGKLKKETIRELMLNESIRLDGRKFDEIRDIWTEIDYLPSAHGSAIFTRGETQSLTSITLGTKLDKMMIDTAMDNYYEKFILHYNFPALSVGEVKMMRGPGRREVGHANLAGRSLKKVLPEENPYTIRIVSDIMESNGSSSMATVCAGSLAMMDAGLQIKAPVSGIAMGMISENGKHAILSDILGDEDALGDMDFKVTGTAIGITGCQMDIKIDGLPYEILEQALNQAKSGRLHILDEMAKTISEPRPDFKPFVPRMVVMEIDKSFIGAVIGPGGKIIQDLQERTSTIITIDEENGKGIIHISGSDKEGMDKAIGEINKISHVPDVGDVYEGVVASVMPYGVFVDFMGKSGLLHVSEIDHKRIENVADFFKEGDEIQVKLIDIDQRSGKYRLSRKVLLPKPERKENKEA